VVDLVRSAAFYDAALAPLGYVRVWTHETTAGYKEAAVGYGREDFQVETAFMDIVRSKRNEGIIGMKANRLAAAESYFIRGLAVFALTFLIGLCLS